MALQKLDDYVRNMGDMRAYDEWRYFADKFYDEYRLTLDQANAKAFEHVFPRLTLPDCFKP